MSASSQPRRVTTLVVRACLILAFVTGLSACSTRVYYENPPMMPDVIEPVAEAVLVNGTPVRFVWRESDRAESYEFHIFDRTNSDIQRYYLSGLMPATVCANGVCSISVTLSMPVDKGHAWRVRAYNNAGFSTWTRKIFKIQ